MRAATGVAAAGLLLGACGIRPTEVPTDFGPAPSRAPCALSGPDEEAKAAPEGIPVQVFLVCATQLVTVDRAVRLPTRPESADRLRVAQALLGQLRRMPSEAEREAGYKTEVPQETRVSGPREGDPDSALRLSIQPEDLSTYALAQLVCSYTASAAADEGHGIVLGGPDPEPLRRYECPEELRARPGTQVPPDSVVERD
ncbi:hypothetical protein HUT18_09625 [Streptomyces sp. NA04227]|nr:hypothetical protein HUT18_09625 [Streptomyces sp. NA04227]